MRVFATWKGRQYPAVIRNIDTAVQVEWLDWKYDNVAWVGMDEIEQKEGEDDGATEFWCRTGATLALSIAIAGLIRPSPPTAPAPSVPAGPKRKLEDRHIRGAPQPMSA